MIDGLEGAVYDETPTQTWLRKVGATFLTLGITALAADLAIPHLAFGIRGLFIYMVAVTAGFAIGLAASWVLFQGTFRLFDELALRRHSGGDGR